MNGGISTPSVASDHLLGIPEAIVLELLPEQKL